MKKISMLLIVICLIVGCAPSTESIQAAIAETQSSWTIVPSQTAYPTYTAPPPVIYTKIVTETYTPSPLFTPTITNTPTLTNTRTSTKDPTKLDKIDGSYMVGTEIAPGIWRSSGGSSDESCWITIKNLSGDLEDIANDLPGGTIRIPAGQYMVYIGGGSGNQCTWSFLMP